MKNKGQIDFLLRHECDIGQGFYYSKPMPSENLIDSLLAEQNDLLEHMSQQGHCA